MSDDDFAAALDVDCAAIMNGALDGGDHRTAALALMAHPASAALPDIAVKDLWRIAAGSGDLSEIDGRKVQSIVTHLERTRRV